MWEGLCPPTYKGKNFMEYRDKTTQKVAVSASSTQSVAISENIYKVRFICTAACHFKVDINPTATDTDAFLPANDYIYLGISPGEKIGIRTVSGGGSAFITELSQ